MRSQNDSDQEQKQQKINENVNLKLKQLFKRAHESSSSTQLKSIYKEMKASMIKQKMNYPPNQNFQQFLDYRNIPNIDCVSCGNFLFPDLSYLLRYYTKPFVIFQQDQFNKKILPSISAVANQGGGNIAIVKQYEQNFIRKGLRDNQFYKLGAEYYIQNAINQIYGRRSIQHQIKYMDIFRRKQQFASLITIKVDPLEAGKIFSVKNYKDNIKPSSFIYNEYYDKASYILTKNYKTYQFQIHPDNRHMVKSIFKKTQVQPIICSCYRGFKELRQSKFSQYKINEQLYDKPQLLFAEVCQNFLRFAKREDFPQILKDQYALILKIHHYEGQKIIKDIKQILTQAKIESKSWFPAEQLQKKFKKPNLVYYQIRCLTFPKINVNYQNFKKQLIKKLKGRQQLFHYRLLSKKIIIRETLSHYQMDCLFQFLNEFFGFCPIQNTHYDYNNNVLEYMMNMDSTILFSCYLIAHLANKTVFFQ